MGLFGSLSAGVTGLLAQGEAISVISDNLSNVNTIGYKNTRTLFDQQVTSAGLSGTIFNAGGVGTAFDRFQSAQGAFIATQSSTDLALSGNGFFVVADSREITTDTGFFYTRAGAFTEDSLGFLTTPNSGHHLLGWRTESDGTIQDIQDSKPVELQSVGSSARATSELDVGINLDKATDVWSYNPALTIAQNIQNVVQNPSGDDTAVPPIEGFDYTTDVRFFDSQGGARDVRIGFTKRADNLWDWAMYTDGGEILQDIFGNLTSEGTNAVIGMGELNFNVEGHLKYATNTNLTIPWSGGVQNGIVSMNLGDFTGGAVFDTTTASGTLTLAQDVMGYTLNDHASNTNVPSTLAGTYTFGTTGVLNANGNYDITLTEPDATVWTAEISPNAVTRTVEWGNGVSMTFGPGWAPGGAWVGAVDVSATTLAIAPKDIGRGSDGLLQFESVNNTLFANQDGFGSGTLANISVDEEGFVVGSFTNGESKKLWKLVISVFQDPAELEPVGNNLLRETDGSGRPLFKQAGIGGTATVVSGSLEQSTVDIAQEFSNMIVSQRAFQASSTIISTVDQMLNELLQLR